MYFKKNNYEYHLTVVPDVSVAAFDKYLTLKFNLISEVWAKTLPLNKSYTYGHTFLEA